MVNFHEQIIPLKPLYSPVSEKSSYKTYIWGEEGPLVLLAHGWSGRASQMAVLAAPLIKAGFKVMTFDAFAHGASPGKQSNLAEFKQIIAHIYKKQGPFQAIIGHSLGGIAACLAVSEGVKTEKLITIGSPATMDYIVESFCLTLGARLSSGQYLFDYVKKMTGLDPDYFSLAKIVGKLDNEGLIIHDRDDKESAYEQALLVAENWKGGRLVSTSGLGHQRILRDKEVIRTIVDFVSVKSSVEMMTV